MSMVLTSDLINVKKQARYFLRSNSGTSLLHAAGKMKKSFGDRSLNALPASLRNIHSTLTLKFCLKPHLFKLSPKLLYHSYMYFMYIFSIS